MYLTGDNRVQIVLTSAASCCAELCKVCPKLLRACAALPRRVPHLGRASTGSGRFFTEVPSHCPALAQVASEGLEHVLGFQERAAENIR